MYVYVLREFQNLALFVTRTRICQESTLCHPATVLEATHQYGCFCELRILVADVLVIRALVFGLYTSAPDLENFHMDGAQTKVRLCALEAAFHHGPMSFDKHVAGQYPEGPFRLPIWK